MVEPLSSDKRVCTHDIINTSEVRDRSYGRCWCAKCGETMPWRYTENGVKMGVDNASGLGYSISHSKEIAMKYEIFDKVFQQVVSTHRTLEAAQKRLQYINRYQGGGCCIREVA